MKGGLSFRNWIEQDSGCDFAMKFPRNNRSKKSDTVRAVDHQAGDEPQANAQTICPGCGSPVGAQDLFCPVCSHPIYEHLRRKEQIFSNSPKPNPSDVSPAAGSAEAGSAVEGTIPGQQPQSASSVINSDGQQVQSSRMAAGYGAAQPGINPDRNPGSAGQPLAYGAYPQQNPGNPYGYPQNQGNPAYGSYPVYQADMTGNGSRNLSPNGYGSAPNQSSPGYGPGHNQGNPGYSGQNPYSPYPQSSLHSPVQGQYQSSPNPGGNIYPPQEAGAGSAQLYPGNGYHPNQPYPGYGYSQSNQNVSSNPYPGYAGPYQGNGSPQNPAHPDMGMPRAPYSGHPQMHPNSPAEGQPGHNQNPGMMGNGQPGRNAGYPGGAGNVGMSGNAQMQSGMHGAQNYPHPSGHPGYPNQNQGYNPQSGTVNPMSTAPRQNPQPQPGPMNAGQPGSSQAHPGMPNSGDHHSGMMGNAGTNLQSGHSTPLNQLQGNQAQPSSAHGVQPQAGVMHPGMKPASPSPAATAGPAGAAGVGMHTGSAAENGTAGYHSDHFAGMVNGTGTVHPDDANHLHDLHGLQDGTKNNPVHINNGNLSSITDTGDIDKNTALSSNNSVGRNGHTLANAGHPNPNPVVSGIHADSGSNTPAAKKGTPLPVPNMNANRADTVPPAFNSAMMNEGIGIGTDTGAGNVIGVLRTPEHPVAGNPAGMAGAGSSVGFAENGSPAGISPDIHATSIQTGHTGTASNLQPDSTGASSNLQSGGAGINRIPGQSLPEGMPALPGTRAVPDSSSAAPDVPAVPDEGLPAGTETVEANPAGKTKSAKKSWNFINKFKKNKKETSAAATIEGESESAATGAAVEDTAADIAKAGGAAAAAAAMATAAGAVNEQPAASSGMAAMPGGTPGLSISAQKGAATASTGSSAQPIDLNTTPLYQDENNNLYYLDQSGQPVFVDESRVPISGQETAGEGFSVDGLDLKDKARIGWWNLTDRIKNANPAILYGGIGVIVVLIGVGIWYFSFHSKPAFTPGSYISLSNGMVYASPDGQEQTGAVVLAQMVDIQETQSRDSILYGKVDGLGWVKMQDGTTTYFVTPDQASLTTNKDGQVYNVNETTATYTFPGREYPEALELQAGTRIRISEVYKDPQDNTWGRYETNGWAPLHFNQQALLSKTDQSPTLTFDASGQVIADSSNTGISGGDSDTSQSAAEDSSSAGNDANSSSGSDSSSDSSSSGADSETDSSDSSSTDSDSNSSSSSSSSSSGSSSSGDSSGKKLDPPFSIPSAVENYTSGQAVVQSVLKQAGVQMSLDELTTAMEVTDSFGAYPIDAARILSEETDHDWIAEQLLSDSLSDEAKDKFMDTVKNRVDSGLPVLAVLPAGALGSSEDGTDLYILISGYGAGDDGSVTKFYIQAPTSSALEGAYMDADRLLSAMSNRSYFTYIY